jgi:putative hydrolase of the HAD superfamily
MRYHLVCLDAGYTLFRPRWSLVDTLATALAREGQALDAEARRRALVAVDDWFWQTYHCPGNRTWASDTAIRELWQNYLRLTLTQLELPAATPSWLDQVLAAHFHPATYELYPDVLPTLEALHARGLPIGVVSDWDSQLPTILAGLGIDHYFSFVVASGAVGLSKPSPAIFELALRRSGTAAGAALMVGDSYHSDVGGARAAGLDALLLDREGTAQAQDVGVIRTLTDLLSRIELH